MFKTYRSWVGTWGASLLTMLVGLPLAPAEDPPPIEGKKPVKQQFKGAGIYGTVTRLGKDGFSVKGQVTQPIGPPNRYKAELDFQPSARFDQLRAGQFPRGLPAAKSYLPENLQVGDLVNVDFDRLGGADICTTISILKRPGGRVPPSPNVKRDEQAPHKYHEYANAKQDWEDRGIPLPDKFKPKTSLVPTVIPVPDLPATRPVPRTVKPIPPAKP